MLLLFELIGLLNAAHRCGENDNPIEKLSYRFDSNLSVNSLPPSARCGENVVHTVAVWLAKNDTDNP